MAISNSDDVINGFEVKDRIKELEESIEEANDAVSEWNDLTDDEKVEVSEPDGLDDDEVEELRILKGLDEAALEACSEWPDGEALFRDTYFPEYAEELAKEISGVDEEAWNRWPLNEIDWDSAAETLQTDYADVDFDGVRYWIRSY